MEWEGEMRMLDLKLTGAFLSLPWITSLTVQTLALLALCSLVFDIVHYVLHRFAKSRFRLLRALGDLHETHHRFFDRELRFVDELSARNLKQHVVPEFLTRTAALPAALWIFSPIAVGLVFIIQGIQFVMVLLRNGRDTNHVAVDRLLAPRGSLMVGARYHALHHLHPDAYFGSLIPLFDKVFGTALSLRGRRVALSGATGAFGSALKAVLEKEGAEVRPLKFGVDFTYDDYSKLDGALAESEILVLAHGSKKDFAMQANCDSFVAIIERFLQLQRNRRFPPEVWALGSEIEFHPAWGNADLQIYLESKRAFAKHAYGYYRDERMIYRHICPAAFRSRMGWAPFSAAAAVAMTMFLVRRGFRYVAVTYTGIACLNYVKFLLPRSAEKPESESTPGIAV
jgi:hypothetical protein